MDRGVNTSVEVLRTSIATRQAVSALTGVDDIRVGTSPPTAASTRDVAKLMVDLASQTQDLAVQEIGRAGLRRVIEVAPDAVTLPTSSITLTYMCGNKFRLRNRVLADLRLRYDVYGTPISGPLEVTIPPVGATDAEMFFFARAKGTVRVFFGSQLLQTKANGGKSCS